VNQGRFHGRHVAEQQTKLEERKMMKSVFMSLFTLLVAFQTAHAALYCSDDFEDGSLDGWTSKIGDWRVVEETGNHYLNNNGSDYGVIWKDGSQGVDQKVQVDAYFDLSDSSPNNTIAHLRLRTGEHSGATQPFWDTGYLAQFTPDSVLILNLDAGCSTITQYAFGAGESPINSSGWYTLTFEVTGTGSSTHFKVLVGGGSYIDDTYNNTIDALDSGYVGLGRLIKYDNFSCSTDVAAVPTPTPTAAVLGILGLCTAGAKFRRR
jgi:hypothetical protein